MPWTAANFRSRHNKGLSDSNAKKAAKIANAILKRTGDEGLAIATANARAEGHKPKLAHQHHFARAVRGG